MKYRRKTQQQINACFHHGGRVQKRTHRSGCGHGFWEPEMERKLSRLGKRGHCDKHGDGSVQTGFFRPEIRGDNIRQVGCSSLSGHNRHRRQQGQTAGKSEDQCAHRTRLAARSCAGDEQERTNGHQLPGNKQHHNIVRQHQ